MIRLPNDYDNARGFDGNALPQLTPGGHICRIQGARVEQSRKGKDMLVIAFDIVEGGEFDGYFKERYDRSAKYDVNAKWPGLFRVTILNGEGGTNGYFKGFIEAVEASNNGYNFKATGGDEQTLKGKCVGFNFGEEEYENRYGEIKTSVKPAYAISVSKVREGVAPPAKKLLDATKRYAQSGGQGDAGGFTDYNEELPF